VIAVYSLSIVIIRFASSEYNESVKEATRQLYEEHIPTFSKKLPQLIYTHKEGFFRIDEAIHSFVSLFVISTYQLFLIITIIIIITTITIMYITIIIVIE
jgi:hypothetical protein